MGVISIEWFVGWVVIKIFLCIPKSSLKLQKQWRLFRDINVVGDVSQLIPRNCYSYNFFARWTGAVVI